MSPSCIQLPRHTYNIIQPAIQPAGAVCLPPHTCETLPSMTHVLNATWPTWLVQTGPNSLCLCRKLECYVLLEVNFLAEIHRRTFSTLDDPSAFRVSVHLQSSLPRQAIRKPTSVESRAGLEDGRLIQIGACHAPTQGCNKNEHIGED